MVDPEHAPPYTPSQFINIPGFKVYNRRIKNQELNDILVVHVSHFAQQRAFRRAKAIKTAIIY